jgi:hypothetical protein
MIDRDQLELRSCLSKVAHGTKREADAHARRVPKKDGKRAKVYRCAFAPDHSPHYHVGHNFKDRKGRLNLDLPAFVTQHRA